MVLGALPVALAFPAVAQSHPPVYVALGDSYTAGPGIPNQLFDPLGCFRSDHDYPHLVAQALGLSLRDVSCSGAETADMTSAQEVFGGANRPQLQAVDAETDVVTLSIGGNDLGFTEISSDCTSLLPSGTPCQRRYVTGAGDELARRISETAPKVAAVLTEIHRRAPRAKVFVVGYPAVLPDGGTGCWPTMPYTAGDVPYLRGVEKQLNAMLAAQAAARATFVDVYPASIGHDTCALPTARWVEPVVPLAVAAPIHPNSVGMAGVAAVVAAKMRAAR